MTNPYRTGARDIAAELRQLAEAEEEYLRRAGWRQSRTGQWMGLPCTFHSRDRALALQREADADAVFRADVARACASLAVAMERAHDATARAFAAGTRKR